jgi:hypothetical protein
MKPSPAAKTVAAVVTVLAIAAGVAGCGGGRASFERRVFSEIERAFTAEGLQVCSVDKANRHANQAVASRQYRLALDCGSDDDTKVIVDEFSQAEDRDAAARNFEVQGRPRAGGEVWTLGRFSIVVSGQLDDDVVKRVTRALDGIGAE